MPTSASSARARPPSPSTRRTRRRSASTSSSTSSVRRFVLDGQQLAKFREVEDDLPGARARHRHGPGRRRGRCDHARRASRTRALARRRRVRRARRVGHPRGHVRVHVHVRHHRPAQGLHPHARQLTATSPRWRSSRGGRRGRRHLPVPAARPRVRAADPVRGARPRRDARLLGEGPAEDRAQPDGGEADLLPVGPAHLREAPHAGHLQRRGSRAAPPGGPARSQGPPAAGPGRGGPGGAPGGLRPGGGEAVRERAEPLRRSAPPGRDRGCPDCAGDPGVLLRLRRPRCSRATG